MSKQHNFYFIGSDYDFIDNFCTKNELCIIPMYITENEIHVLKSIHELINFRFRAGLIISIHEINKLLYRFIPTTGYYSFKSHCIPAIEIGLCYTDNNILRRERVYYEMGYYDENDNWLIPTQYDIDKKAVHLINECRRRSKKIESGVYVGNETLSRIMEGTLKLDGIVLDFPAVDGILALH